MPSGLRDRFNVLSTSPLDQVQASSGGEPAASADPPPAAVGWLPSRYTFRARTVDGRLALWNSHSGAIAVFKAEQVAVIERMLSRKGFDAEEKGIVKYLAERGFLVHQDTDEYKVFQLAFGQAQHRSDILELILLASEDCNLRCVYCYEKFARGTMLPEIRQGVKELVKRRLPGLRALTIGWFGGEPLYGMAAIDDLAPFFAEVAREHQLAFFSHMTTNGYLLTAETSAKLLDWGVRNFQITLDGPPTCHDHSRPTREGGPTFDVILANLRALAAMPAQFVVDLRVNFSPPNVPVMGELLALVEREFAGDPRFRMRFRAVGKWGGDQDDELDVCGKGESDRLIMEFERQARERGIALADGFKATSSFGSQVCYAARPYNFIVGATGKLMKCTIELDQDERNIVGQIYPDGRAVIDATKVARWAAPAFEQDAQCQRCAVLPVCQGCSCPLPRIQHGERSCIPARGNWKRDLLALVDKPPAAISKIVTG